MTKRSTQMIDLEIGERIRRFREMADMSQTELADVLGVTFQQIQKYEKGANRVSTAALVLMCKALGVGPMDVIGPYFVEGPTAFDELSQKVVGLEAKLAQIKSLAA